MFAFTLRLSFLLFLADLFIICGVIALTYIYLQFFGVFWIELSGSVCPLTPLENWLDELGGGSTYRSSFIEQYIIQFLYPTDLDQNTKYYLAAGLIFVNLIIYIHIMRKRSRRKNMNIHDRINERAQQKEKKSLF